MPGKRWSQLKAQATIFVVLGIVLMAVFAFALYARSLLTTDRAQQEADRILTDVIQTNSINYYVENCLEDVSTEALLEAAEKGGYLNDSGVPWDDYFLYNSTEGVYEVGYASKPNERCDEVFLDAPQYPRPRTKLDELDAVYAGSSCKHDRISGFFGMSLLTKLCDALGANAFTETQGHTFLACKSGAYTIMPDNLQRRLQDAITHDLKRCANFSVYEEVLGHNVTVHEDKANTTVIYGEDKVHVTATYPFTVKVSGGQTVVAMHEFSYTSPYRFKQVYEYFMELLKQENQDHTFNLSEDYDSISDYDPAFDVKVFQDSCRHHDGCPTTPTSTLYAEFDDVVRIEDTRQDARVDNRSLVFHATIKNRRPALDYIHETKVSAYDILAHENDTLWLTPEGYDPDDMGVSYDYEGWREDWNAWYNFTCAETCLEPSCDRRTDCVERDHTVQPENWTRSQPYQHTGRDAKINLSRNDTGLHNVTVRIRDDTGLEDFQVVRILVYDLPVARPNGSNMIPGISDEYASIEDPYLLNGSESTASQLMDEQLSNWLWTGSYDGNVMFFIDSTTAINTTPIEGRFYSWDAANGILGPQDITNQPINTTESAIPVGPGGGLKYTINHTVTSATLASDPATYEIQVYECLPVRNDTHTNAYPYNDTDSTSYDHTCCLGTTTGGEPDSSDWGEVADTGKTCYERWETGILQQLWTKSYFQEHGNPEVQVAENEKYIGITTNPSKPITTLTEREYQNDGFNLTYERACDGKRGNTCTGEITKTYDQIKSCPDYYHSTDDERCQGWVGDECKIYTYNEHFNRNTFEQDHYYSIDMQNRTGGNPNGICNEHERCADPGTKNYDYSNNQDDGDHLCKGGCAGSDGCTKPVECQCDIDKCDATCEDGVEDFKLGSDTCSSHCRSQTCTYNWNDQACPEQCILDQNMNNDQFSFYTNCKASHNPSQQEYCHYHRGCTEDAGCVLDDIDTLRKDHCDTCTSSGFHEGEYCPEAGTVEEGICYISNVSPRSCDGNTCKNIIQRPLEPMSVQCQATQGVAGVRCTETEVQCCNPATDTNCKVPNP